MTCKLSIPALVLALGLFFPALSSAANHENIKNLQQQAQQVQSQQRQLANIKTQRLQALRLLPQLRAQARESRLVADRAQLTYQAFSRQAAGANGRLDRVTFKYIQSVQSLGYSRAMSGSLAPELAEMAGTVSAADAVLVYSQGQMIINQAQGRLDKLRAIAEQAAVHSQRTEAANLSAQVARQQADASLERQRQISQLLKRTELMGRSEMRRQQSQLATLFNRLLGDPELPGIDISAIGLPAQQRLVLLSLREWKKGVQEEPMGSNDSPDIARYRTATAGAIRGGAWCAYFASYLVRRAGLPIGPGGRGTGLVVSVAEWGRQNNRFFAADDRSFKPQAGDMVIWPSHMGMVISAKGRSMLTVEGNASDRVMRQRRAISQAVGFVRVWGPELKGAKQQGNPRAGSPSGGIL